MSARNQVEGDHSQQTLFPKNLQTSENHVQGEPVFMFLRAEGQDNRSIPQLIVPRVELAFGRCVFLPSLDPRAKVISSFVKVHTPEYLYIPL